MQQKRGLPAPNLKEKSRSHRELCSRLVDRPSNVRQVKLRLSANRYSGHGDDPDAVVQVSRDVPRDSIRGYNSVRASRFLTLIGKYHIHDRTLHERDLVAHKVITTRGNELSVGRHAAPDWNREPMATSPCSRARVETVQLYVRLPATSREEQKLACTTLTNIMQAEPIQMCDPDSKIHQE